MIHHYFSFRLLLPFPKRSLISMVNFLLCVMYFTEPICWLLDTGHFTYPTVISKRYLHKQRNNIITISREEATSALAGFHVRLLFCLNWNLEIWETQPTYGTEPKSKPGHNGGRCAFWLLRHLTYPNYYMVALRSIQVYEYDYGAQSPVTVYSNHNKIRKKSERKMWAT